MLLNKIKTIISVLAVVLFISINGSAEPIKLSGPFSQTGSYQKIIRLVVGELKTKGWDIDVKITGNPLLSKQTFEQSTEKVILVWGLDTNSNKSSKDYLKPIDNGSFLGMMHVAPQYFCVVNNKDISLNDFLSQNKKLKIGTPTDALLVNWFGSFKSDLGLKHTAVIYKDSNRVGNALLSGEIDVAMTSGGAKLHTAGKVKCILSTAENSVLGIPTLKATRPTYQDSVLVVGSYAYAKNFSNIELINFKKDFAVALQSESLRNHLKGRFNSTPTAPLAEQLLFIKKLDSKLK
jgi:hypothetical protein